VIVKVQLSLYTTESERQVLIHDETRSVFYMMSLSQFPSVEEKMAGDIRAFFNAIITNGQIKLGDRVQEQDW